MRVTLCPKSMRVNRWAHSSICELGFIFSSFFSCLFPFFWPQRSQFKPCFDGTSYILHSPCVQFCLFYLVIYIYLRALCNDPSLTPASQALSLLSALGSVSVSPFFCSLSHALEVVQTGRDAIQPIHLQISNNSSTELRTCLYVACNTSYPLAEIQPTKNYWHG